MIASVLVTTPTVAQAVHMTQNTNFGPHTVGRVGYGAMQLAGPGVMGPPRDPDVARAVLRRAIELGVDHVDTSQFYGPDVVNELIREALHPYPDGLRIATKVGTRRDEAGAWLPAQTPAELRAAVEENLRTLGVERMDLVNLRRMDDHGVSDVPLAEQLGALDDLRREGKLELIGLSTVSRAQLEEGLALTEIAGVQNAFSILDRSGEDVLELCAERGLAFVPYVPLGSAFNGGPAKIAADPAIAATAEKHGVLPTQVALAWLLHHDEHVLLIPGTGSVSHLEENVAVRDIALDADDLALLDTVRPAADPTPAEQPAAAH
jgi:aryl-alcohol dehydrogenase-like predicted oxidoreductase